MDIMASLSVIGPLFQSGRLSEGLQQVCDLWLEIPEPRTATPNAYLVIEYGVAFSLKIPDLAEAQRWAALAPAFAEVRHQSGEVEFLVGKVAIECGDTEVAKEQFLIAYAKSEGRMFQGENDKYLKLIR